MEEREKIQPFFIEDGVVNTTLFSAMGYHNFPTKPIIVHPCLVLIQDYLKNLSKISRIISVAILNS